MLQVPAPATVEFPLGENAYCQMQGPTTGMFIAFLLGLRTLILRPRHPPVVKPALNRRFYDGEKWRDIEVPRCVE